MKLNEIYLGDCLDYLPKVKGDSVDLYIADPPYFKVVNEKWDHIWKTEKEYTEWCLIWLKEISRTLRLGGSFYLFGYFRNLALLIPYLDELGLELRQQIIVNKGMRSVSGRATKNYRMFPNVTESILFITKDNKQFVKPFLKQHQEKLGLSSKEINEALGVKSNGGGMWSIYTGENICEQFPTRELWEKLRNVLKFELDYCRIAQTYNPIMKVTDVWDDINFYDEERYHPTQKPLKLIDRLINASSNEGDLVVDPFLGAGSTTVVAKRNNRKYIGIEKEEKYFNISKQRLNGELF